VNKIDFIFKVMRSALWQQPMKRFEFPAEKYKSLMKSADKQCVMGLMADGLKTSNIGLERESFFHLLKLEQTLTEENEKVNANLHELCQILQEAGIPFMVVKGQVAGAFYPKPELRMPGDIDFYVPQKHFDRATSMIFERLGKETDESNDRHIALKHNGTVYEAHRYLLRFPNKKMQRQFDQLVESNPAEIVTVNGEEVPTLMPTLNVLYTFLHLFNHFIQIGVALRQLCDLAMMLHSLRDRIDRELLDRWLKEYDITRAFIAFGAILTDKMGLPKEEFPYPITDSDREYGEKVLRLIVKHGNWGAYRRKNHDSRSLSFMLERSYIRLSNHVLFYRLAPKYNRALIFGALPRKIWGKLIHSA
jgi:hypothetical protein